MSDLISNDNIPSGKMAQTGLLIVSNLAKIPNILGNVRQHVSKTLYVTLRPVEVLPVISYSKHITQLYTQSTEVCSNLNIHILMENLKTSKKMKIITRKPIEVVMFDESKEKDEAQDYVQGHITNLKQEYSIVNIGDNVKASPAPDVSMTVEGKSYDFVALGGTFDRLHTGHKILLSEGILRARKHLAVGVTGTNMIKSKKLWELIEPVEVRIEKVREFLYEVDPSLEYNVVPIQDMYGPTKEDTRLQLLVVSQETIRGGDKVNEKRRENGLPEMEVYSIDLAAEAEGHSSEEEDKVSSSNSRMRTLGTVIKEPQENKNIPSHPYVIGLTGGIASGKTKIAERLGNLGAGVVNCDLLAHELYRAGQPLNATIAETFGRDVIMQDGEVDRKKLGSIVFNDPTRLIELNNLLWPAIRELARKRVEELGRQGFKVVVMEAAVLLQAGWQGHCHQVWTSIIPADEAVKRLKERNGLSEEMAKDRLSSQPSNSEQVAAANVVFSSLWSYDYTSEQVSKAWRNLQEYLEARSKQAKM